MHESVNQAIESLWQRHYPQCDAPKLWPLAINKIQAGSILFVGLNPSFSEKGWKTTAGEEFDPNKFYAWGGNEYDREKDLELEANAKKTYSYYAKFRDIADKFGKPWEHIDLFFVRETSQNKFNTMLSFGSQQGEILNDFAKEQLKQSIRLIEASQPLVIVVANAYASDLYRKMFESQLSGSRFEELGYHYTCLNNRQVPTFFTSMLTQQRALDKGSLERLKWQIGQALKRESQEPCG